MIDLEKLSSPMTSVNAQVKNSPVDGGVRNMVGLTTSKENLKMKTTSAVDADKKAVSSAKNSPNHCVNSEQSSKNHEHNQEQNGFVTLVNKECSSKGKPTHDSEMAALGEKNCRNSKENAVLPVNSDSHLKESKDADELRKVLENVEHDVNLDNLKMKSSCIESQKTSDAIENSVRTIASVTNNSQKAKENVFDKFQNMVKSAECDANTLHENLVKDSVDELDDISIDLTEEEEEALLRPDPDVDLNVSKGSNNSKGNQASSKSSVSTSTEQKLKVTCGKKADGVADEKCSSDSVAEVIPVDAIYDVPKGKDVDSKSEAMEVVNETEDVPLDKEAEYKTTKVGGDSVASEESAKPEIQTLIPERLSSKDNLGECSELKRKLTLDDEKQVEKLGLTVKKVKLDSEPKSEDAKPVDISKSILLSRLKSNDSSVKKEKCCIKLSKQELEDLNAKMITLYLTESERSDIAALKAKCESLEKCLEDWKRKAKGAQIQNVELKIALQRAIHQRKEKPGGPGQIVKVSTRTVGLQVQMQSFLVPDEKQRLQGTRPTNVKYLPPTVVPVPVSNPPPIGFPKVQFPPGGLPTTAAAAALKPGSNLMSPIGAVATRMVNPQGKSGVSILQPRLIASQASLSPVAAVNGIPRVASVTTPTSSTPVRALLDSRRVQADMNDESGNENVNPDIIEDVSAVEMENSVECSQLLDCLDSADEEVIGARHNPGDSENMQNVAKASIRIVQRFLQSCQETRELSKILPEQLDDYLSSFFSCATKSDGTDYSTHSLACIYDSIDCFLRDNDYFASLKKDAVFSPTRESLRCKWKCLKEGVSAEEISSCLVQCKSSSGCDVRDDDNNPCTLCMNTENNLGSHFDDSKESMTSSCSSPEPAYKEDHLEKLLTKYHTSDNGIEIIKIDTSLKRKLEETDSESMFFNKYNRLETCSFAEIRQNTVNNCDASSGRNADQKIINRARESSEGALAYGIPNSVSMFLQWLQASVQHETHPLHDIPSGVLDGYIAAYIESQKTNISNAELWTTAKTFWDELCDYLGYFNYFCNLNIGIEFPRTLELLTSLKYQVGVVYTSSLDRSYLGLDAYEHEKTFSSNEVMDDVQLFMNWLEESPFSNKTQLLDIYPPILDDYLLNFFYSRNDNSIYGLQELSRFFANLLKYLMSNKYVGFDHNSNCLPKATLYIRQIQERLDASALAELDYQDDIPSGQELVNSGSFSSPVNSGQLTLSLNTSAMTDGSDLNYKDDSSDCNQDTLLSSLLEPDISLVEDDSEIVLKVDKMDSPDNMISNNQDFQVQLLIDFLKCGIVNESRELYELPPDQLNIYLEQFYTVSANATSSPINYVVFQDCLNNYLQQHKYAWSLLNDDWFEGSRKRLSERALCEAASGKDNTIERLYQNKTLNKSCPASLLCTLWFYMKEKFNILSCEEHASLLWCDFKLRTENGGDCLEYCKTSNLLNGLLPVVSTDSLFISAYKTYRQARPMSTVDASSKFYLQLSSTCQYGVWFSDVPLVTRQLEALEEYIGNIMQTLECKVSELEMHKWFIKLTVKLRAKSSFHHNPCENSNLLPVGILNITSKCSEQRSIEIKNNSVPFNILKASSFSIANNNMRPEKQHLFNPLRQQRDNLKLMQQQFQAKPNVTLSPEDEALKSEFSSRGSALNTISKTLHDVNLFKDWLAFNKKDQKIHEMAPSKLAHYLLQFLKTVKKSDGSNYLPNSLRAILFSIDRYLKIKKYKANIKIDPSFQECQKLIQERSRRQRATADPVLKTEDIRFLNLRRLVGPWSPEAMIMALWYVNSKLGVGNYREHLHLKWGDIVLRCNNDGSEYLEHHPVGKAPSSLPLKMYAMPGNPAECPVKLFKTYRLRRPPNLLSLDSCFYLYPNRDRSSNIWFLDVPLSQNKLANMPFMIQELIKKAKRQPVDGGHVSTVATNGHLAKRDSNTRLETGLPPSSVPVVTVTSLRIEVPNMQTCAPSLTSSGSLVASVPSISLIPLSQRSDSLAKTGNVVSHSVASSDHVVMFPVSSCSNMQFSPSSVVSNGGVQIIPLQ